jgi:hypothetical protein
MDKQFDELSKSLAEEGVSRRELLGRIVTGIAGVLLAVVGLQTNAPAGIACSATNPCGSGKTCCGGVCVLLGACDSCFCGVACPAGMTCRKQTGHNASCGTKHTLSVNYYCA